MKLTIDELARLFDLILVYLKKEKSEELLSHRNNDYYVKIDYQRVNFEDTEPIRLKDYAIESLGDTVKILKRLLNEQLEPTAYEFEKFGSLLSVLGYLIEGKWDIFEDDADMVKEKYENQVAKKIREKIIQHRVECFEKEIDTFGENIKKIDKELARRRLK